MFVIRHYIKATWPLRCFLMLSPRLFGHRLNQLNNKDPVHVRDHSVLAPGQWGATLQCRTISHCLGAYTEYSLKVLPWWFFVWEKHQWIPCITSWGYQVVGPALWLVFLLLTWLRPWTNSQRARKLMALMLMWWVSYDGNKNMYQNRNVHLYLTDFYHVSDGSKFYIIFGMDINENQMHPLSLQYPMPRSVEWTTRNVAWPFLLWDQAAQDTCPIRTSAPEMPHNQLQDWLLLTEAEMEIDPTGCWWVLGYVVLLTGNVWQINLAYVLSP